jgi:integrase/recombinase XerD
VFEREQGRRLFAALDAAAATGNLLALRDRALFAVMLYGFVRVGAIVKMTVRDFEDGGEHAALASMKKAARSAASPAITRPASICAPTSPLPDSSRARKVPLFQTAPGRAPALTGEAMTIDDALRAVKRRCRMAALPASLSNHSFRATGITVHQENGGRLEDAQELAGHADGRTTRLYVRRERRLAQAEVERVQL